MIIILKEQAGFVTITNMAEKELLENANPQSCHISMKTHFYSETAC